MLALLELLFETAGTGKYLAFLHVLFSNGGGSQLLTDCSD